MHCIIKSWCWDWTGVGMSIGIGMDTAMGMDIGIVVDIGMDIGIGMERESVCVNSFDTGAIG